MSGNLKRNWERTWIINSANQFGGSLIRAKIIDRLIGNAMKVFWLPCSGYFFQKPNLRDRFRYSHFLFFFWADRPMMRKIPPHILKLACFDIRTLPESRQATAKVFDAQFSKLVGVFSHMRREPKTSFLSRSWNSEDVFTPTGKDSKNGDIKIRRCYKTPKRLAVKDLTPIYFQVVDLLKSPAQHEKYILLVSPVWKCKLIIHGTCEVTGATDFPISIFNLKLRNFLPKTF